MEYKDFFMNKDLSQNTNEIIQQLQDENRMLRRMLDRSSDGIFIVDGREESYGNSMYCNPVLYNLLGVEPDEIIGKSIEDYKGKFVSQMATLDSMRSNQPSTVIQTMVRTQRKALVTSTPIYDADDNLMCFFVQVRDLVKYEKAMEDESFSKRIVKPETSSGLEKAYLEVQQPLIAEDENMLDALKLAFRLAKFDSGILLTGETGVGKEVFAKYIHENSQRKKGPFVTVNCATFQSELIESELFGYESGAFTGAKKTGKIGLFEAAKGGTLFLDEINSLPIDMQGKLLRAIETKKIRAVGGNREHEVDFRLVCATNQPLEQLMENKTFREDLYYRINVFSINIPPLRERKGDIAPLLRHFTNEYSDKYGIAFTLLDEDIEKAMEYSWPGNVRELRNFAEQLVVIGSARLLRLKNKTEQSEKIKSSDKSLPEKAKKASGLTLKERMEICEKEIIREAIERHAFKRDAATELGIDPAVLSRKISKYKL